MMKKIFITMLFAMCSYMASAQYTSIKVNTLHLATGTINLGVDVTIAPKWSVGASAMWNPFLEHSTALTIGAKRWRFESNVGWFIGMQSTAARYTIKKKEGFAVGAGSSIGYAWILSKRWNFSLEGGLGIFYVHDKWLLPDTPATEDIIIRHRERVMLLPSKLEVSFSYLF